MPVLDPVERVKLLQAGEDPDALDPVSEVSEAPQQVSEVTPVAEEPPKKTGVIRSALSHALVGMPSTLVGLEGGAGIGAAGTVLGGPLLGIPAGIVGGIVSGVAARKAQDALLREGAPGLNDSINAELEQTSREHPTASRVGDALAGLIGMKPSVKSLGSAARVITNPLKGSPVLASDVANAANVGLGASMPMIGEVQKNVDLGNILESIKNLPANVQEDIKKDPMGFLSEVGIGGLLNNPNKLGQKLGIHPNIIEPRVGEGLAEATKSSDVVQPIANKAPIALLNEHNPVPPETTYVDSSGNAAPSVDALNPSITQMNEQLKTFPDSPEVVAYKQAQAEHAAAQEKVNAETQVLKAKAQELLNLVGEPQGEITKENPATSVQPAQKTDIETLPDASQSSQVTGNNVNRKINPQRDYTKGQQRALEENSAPMTEAERIQDEYDRGIRNQEEPSKVDKIVKGLEEQDIPTQRTQAYADFYKELAAKRGVKVEDNQRVFDNGKEISGQADIQNRLNKINPNKAQLDTDAHELFHVFMDDMANGGNSKDKALINRAKRVIQESPEFVDWAEKRSNEGYGSSVEEYLTQLTGEDSVRRLLNSDKTGNIKNWFKDFWAYQKSKYGKASPDDISRVMSNRLINDPSYAERYGDVKVNTRPVSEDQKKISNQEDSQLEGFHEQFQNEIARRAEEAKRNMKISDFEAGDILYTPKGTKLKFLYDWPNLNKKGPSAGRRMVFAEDLSTGDKNPYYTDMLSPEPPRANVDSDIKNQDTSPFSPEERAKGSKIQDEQQKLLEEYNGLKEQIKSGSPKEASESYKRLSEVSNKLEQLNSPEPYKNQEESNFGKSRPKEVISTEPKAKEASDESPQRFGLIGEVDRVAANKNPIGKKLATAMTDYYDNHMSYLGKLNGPLQNTIAKTAKLNISDVPLTGDVKAYTKQSNKLTESTLQKLYDRKEGLPVKFSPEEAKIRNAVDASMKANRDMLIARPGIRKVSGYDDKYFPHIIKPSVMDTILKDKSSPESQQLQKDFIKYQASKLAAKGSKNPLVDAGKNLDQLLEAYKGKSVDIAGQYGPLDKAEGIGLSPSWRETNLQIALQRYFDRSARRFAFHDSMEKPEIIKAADTLGGDKHVKTVMNDITGLSSINKPLQKTMAAEGIARSGNLGPLTGLKDLTSTPFLAMQHQANPVRVVTDGIKSLIHINDGIADGIANGRVRHNINSLEWDDTIGVLRRISDVTSEVQGRNFFEKMARGFATELGKNTALGYHEDYVNGNLSKQGKEFFDQFGRGIDWKKSALTRDDLLKFSGRFVDSVQGTYDYRNLPRATKEGVASPLLSLARWNIEKANNYYRHVMVPVSKGNITPLLMSTLGMVLGGTAIQKIVQEVTGRKDKAANFEELKNAQAEGKNISLPLAYKLMGLASIGGYTGVISDIGKSVMDRTYAKVKPRWFNNMLLDAANNTQTSISNFSDAVEEDGMSTKLLTSFIGNVLADQLQSVRLVMDHIDPQTKENIDKSNKYRDLRTFNLIEGNDIKDLSDSDFQKKYKGQDIKDFQQEQDIGKAAGMIPKLLNDAINKADGNPEKLREELDKLKKTEQFATMPNPKTLPLSFLKYVTYLDKTQGSGEGQKRLEEYLVRNAINSEKAKAIPSAG